MYPFPQSVTPAVRSHLDAQTAFLNDVSKSIFQSFQQVCDLNIQLVQTMLEESTIAGQQLFTADRHTNGLSAAAARAPAASEKLRAYQQHISKLAADAQVKLAKVAEEHVQNTTRTAQQLAEEVSRTASEETERGIRTQQETLRKFSDPFLQPGNGQASQDYARERERAGASLQSGTQGTRQASSQGSSQSAGYQGGSAQGNSTADLRSQMEHSEGQGHKPGSATRTP
jgi:hypothetical protein